VLVVRRLVVQMDPRGRSVTVVLLPPGRSGTVVPVLRRLVVQMDPRGRSGTVVRLRRGRSGTVAGLPRGRSGTVVRVLRRLVGQVDRRVRTETLASQGLLDPRAITRKAGVTRHREHRESRGTYLPRSPMMSPLPSSTGPLAGASGRLARTMPTASPGTW